MNSTKVDLEVGRHLDEQLDEAVVVAVRVENFGATVATAEDVETKAAGSGACSAWHGEIMARG